MISIKHEELPTYAATLANAEGPMPGRVSALICLRTVGAVEAVDALIEAFHKEPRSDLLRHEICYSLGQMNKTPEHVAKIEAFFEDLLTKEYP